MTLTTHALVGAGVASFVGYPAAGVVAGFVSHLAIDALPHWNYGVLFSSIHQGDNPLHTDMRGPAMYRDIALLALDAAVGTLLALAIFAGVLQVPWVLVLAGVGGGLLPDALHFVYFKLRPKFMESFQKFHTYIQPERDQKRYLLVEVALIGAVIALRAAIG